MIRANPLTLRGWTAIVILIAGAMAFGFFLPV